MSYDPCPVCRRPSTGQCKCPKAHRICASGHEWHNCLAHEDLRIVIGPADHSLGTLECSCLSSKQDGALAYDPVRRQEALRQAAHMEDDPHGG